MRSKLRKQVAVRAARHGGVLLAGLVAIAGAANSLCSAASPPARSAVNIDAPATLGPSSFAVPKPLPVESLRAVHSLDLSQPVQTPLPDLRVTLRSQSAKNATPQAAISMPALIAPANSPTSIAAAKPPSAGDQPPSAPEQFQPKWRSSGIGQKVADAFSIDEDEAEGATEAPTETEKPSDKAVASTTTEPTTSKAKPAAEPRVDQSAQANTAPAEEAAEPETLEPAEPLKPLTRNQIYLRNKMRKVLTYYYRKPLNSHEHDSWEAMHGMLAYGLHSRIRAGGPRGESMTAIGWLCYNNACKNKQLMRLNDEGEIRAQYGVGLQGHMGQFLAMLAQCNVDPSYPIRVENREFTINDLIVSEQETCYPNTELTFKLIGLMHYLPSDSQWVNDQGEDWSIERLIEEELKQPIRGAACGGTHRLGGLSLAVKKRQARGESLDGAYLKAAKFTNQYEQYAYRLQNSDGSFSTEWFRGPGKERDINRRCRTSGHLLEWLIYQAEEDEMTSYRLVKGVNYLTNLLYSNSDNEWEIGPLCHALHALTLYDQRVFQPHDKQTQTASSKSGPTAQSNTQSRTTRSNQSASSARRSTNGYQSR